MKFLILFLLLSPSLSALDIDGKVITRVVGISDTKKTVLLNKGSEDELKVGDHAKFSIPSGWIARGVCVKASPSRSVWSIYRFYNQEKLTSQLAVTLKISSPISLTNDESKSLGRLAKKIDKKREKIPLEEPVQTKEHKRLKRHFKKEEKIFRPLGGVDFSNLDDNAAKVFRDPELDWSTLDGKRDLNNFDSSIDYSRLR
jgi:hypothetical protein